MDRNDKGNRGTRTPRRMSKLAIGGAAVVAAGLIAGGVAIAVKSGNGADNLATPAANSTATTATTRTSVASASPPTTASATPTSEPLVPSLVSTVLEVTTAFEMDEAAFDGVVTFGLLEEFVRDVTLDCATECELVFDDEEWLWAIGLRIPLGDGPVDTTIKPGFRCSDRAGNDHGFSPVHVTSDLVVTPVDTLVGTVVIESETVPFATPTGAGECSAIRHTIDFSGTELTN